MIILRNWRNLLWELKNNENMNAPSENISPYCEQFSKSKKMLEMIHQRLRIVLTDAYHMFWAFYYLSIILLSYMEKKYPILFQCLFYSNCKFYKFNSIVFTGIVTTSSFPSLNGCLEWLGNTNFFSFCWLFSTIFDLF